MSFWTNDTNSFFSSFLGDKKSTAFAEHFGEHFKELGMKGIDGDHVRAVVECETVWVGERVCAAKSFGKRTCRLCMKERLAMLELSETNPKKMINSRNKLYGACLSPWKLSKGHQEN